MGDGPDDQPHRRYKVGFVLRNGTVRTVRVLTNRGPAKAVHLATLSTVGPLRRLRALDVDVQDDGPPELDSQGVPVLSGYASDRDEW